MAFNITPTEEEILNILEEEAAEVIHMVCKCRRWGIDEQHLKEGGTNRERLTEELGDLLCMINIATQRNIISQADLNNYAAKKKEKLYQWSNIFRDNSLGEV